MLLALGLRLSANGKNLSAVGCDCFAESRRPKAEQGSLSLKTGCSRNSLAAARILISHE